jgi:hypothetical protein
VAYKNCNTGFTTSREECTDWRDDGYESCEAWSQDCVDWAKDCVASWIPWIGPAICKVFEWVCRAFEWVCKAVVWVAQWVCHAWNLITTFVCLLWETALLVLAIPGIFVKAILSIPIIGAFIKQVINFVTAIVIGFVGFIIEGALCGLLGICLAKKLRVCVIIADNGRGPITTEAALQPIIDRMKQIYKSQANINVYPDVESGGPTPNVEPNCGAKGYLEDLWLYGSQYENAASLNCRENSSASVIGLGSPIYAFAVTNVIGKNGCSLGPFSNYVVFEAGNTCNGKTHLAHEIGHTCGLWLHAGDDDTANLMYKSCRATGRDQLSAFQKSIVRGSKYVTYF